jgi:Zn-dependent metalloprotease
MGSLVKQYKLNQTATAADWLIGADIFTPEIKGDGMRSLKAPGTAYNDDLIGKDDQPSHMRDYLETSGDFGGVHTNSGIPNHAFYTVATKLGGNAWERAGRIWYEAIQHPACGPRTGFARFARITVRVAERLYGLGSTEVRAVHDGWDKVGVPSAV